MDTSYIKHLYDRCLEFDETKTDSICYYAALIESESKKIKFKKGPVLSTRLYGICMEFQSDFDKAIDYYLQSLAAARELKNTPYEISALSDLAIIYASIDRPLQAKQFYLECAKLAIDSREVHTVITSYNNLGVIYNQLGLYDSALVFFEQSLALGREKEGYADSSSAINNIGNVWFKKKEYRKALGYFLDNYRRHHLGNAELGQLWTDHLNLADVYTEMKQFDSAQFHASQAILLADSLGSRSKQADSYSMLARLAEHKGDYANAYKYLSKWYQLDTAMVNGNTQSRIAELQERFNARGREAENKLLMERVEKERYRNRSITYLALALGIIGVLIAIAFFIKRNANRKLMASNELVRRQNNRLAELNHEKNTLISIVSHDLGTPFATIQLWAQLLQTGEEDSDTEHKKAVQRIQAAAHHGHNMIQRILDVEKADSMRSKLELTQFNLCQLTKQVTDNMRPTATAKGIRLEEAPSQQPIWMLSDEQMLLRILENLLSNAIKYSPIGGRVWIRLSEEDETARLEVEDEGVGIDAAELPFLFNKYSKISSQPTNGETSTGLGLSIVRRIVSELNGRIYCQSEPGKGARFIVEIKK